MGKGKKIPSYLYESNPDSNFAMVTADLMQADAFKSLSFGARELYITLTVHKQQPIQSMTLFNSLKEYYGLLGESKEDFDLRTEAGQNKRTHIESKKFVIPLKQLTAYGFSASYANKLMKELQKKGFIRVFANAKGGSRVNYDFSKRVAIYEFINDWKNLKSSSQQ